MLIVHHLRRSQSERIVWLMEELGLDYRLDMYRRDPKTRRAPESYTGLHPLGTSPVIQDDGLMLAESAAIVEYVIHRHAGGRLAVDPMARNYAAYLFWFHLANGSVVPAGMNDIWAILSPREEDAGLKASRAKLDRAYRMAEARLGEAPYFAGDSFTAADIMMVFPLTTMRYLAPRDISAYPNIIAYLARIGDRPAYRAALEKAEPGVAPLLT